MTCLKLSTNVHQIPSAIDVQVAAGRAAVFSNAIPHRHKAIVNHGDSIGSRLFVNFFVVDPAKPIVATGWLS
jgi:hypothetical protein